MPLVDALLREDQLDHPEPRWPLEVAFCPACTLVQITEEVPPEKLFVDNYLYFSSVSNQLVEHSRRHALGLIDEMQLSPDSLVVEVASNDGYLLRHLVEAGVPVLGIDPAPEQAAAAEAAGIPTLREFFDADVARRLVGEGKQADVVIANNVMAHTPDLNGFVEGLSILLKPGGVATIENPHVKELIERREFDTIYHEHFSYFSCHAVDALMRSHGLSLNRIESFDLHGGSLRWWVGPTPAVERSVTSYLEDERASGLTEFGYYEGFANDVEALRSELIEMLRGMRAEGGRIAAYGAAAKGAVLCNYAAVDRSVVDFVADLNVHKQGLYMPGVHLPIEPPQRLLDEQPDFVLMLSWNFEREILAQQAEYVRRGGRFIVPVPEPRVVAA
jgi:SAM-dependent methyltransferase